MKSLHHPYLSILAWNHQKEASDRAHHQIQTPKLTPVMTQTCLIGLRLPTRIVIRKGPEDEINERVREEDGRRPTEGNYLSPFLGTRKRMTLFHMMIGNVKWMP